MANLAKGEVRRSIRSLFDIGTVAGLSDVQLLERYTGRRGEVAELAFVAIVERHGPMVFRVCQRVLADPHDAEDAFQAVFLVLMRRARSIRRCESLASWLYGVALRVAAAARAANDRRAVHERRAAGRTAAAVEDRPGEADLGRVLHEEIGRLPERFRRPVVLCYLEGRSHDEAARLLDCPVGTIKSRLATARDKLRVGLTRRGLGSLAGTVGGMLAAERARGAVPPALAEAVRAGSWLATKTNRIATAGSVPAAVATLTEGVLKTMVQTRLRIVAMFLLSIGTAGAGIGALAQQQQQSRTIAPEPGAGMVQASVRALLTPPERDAANATGTGVAAPTVTKPYYIGDLVEIDPASKPSSDLSPIIELIAASVAPGTWKGYDSRGRPRPDNDEADAHALGSFTPFYLSVSLIIRHTADVHDQVADRLRQLRRLRWLKPQPHPLAVSHPEAENDGQRAPSTLAPGSVPRLEDRLRAVERKLDRVLEALEHKAGNGPE